MDVWDTTTPGAPIGCWAIITMGGSGGAQQVAAQPKTDPAKAKIAEA